MTNNLGKPSILIIDDNARLLRGLERVLGEHFNVTTSACAHEAMAMLNMRGKSELHRRSAVEDESGTGSWMDSEPTAVQVAGRPQFDVVIVDNHLDSALLGVQFIATLRRERPEIVPVLMTGEPTQSLRHVVTHDLGGVRLLEKPFGGARLVEVVCTALEQRHRAAADADATLES